MPPRFMSRDSRTRQASSMIARLQQGDLCKECVQELLGIDSRTTLHERLKDAAALMPGGRLLQHPSSSPCSSCGEVQRTVYTLATRLTPRDSQAAPGKGITTLRQDLGAFLTILENRSGQNDPSSEVTVFSPLFVGTDWSIWDAVHRAVHDRKVIHAVYGGRSVTLAPLHLWWAQGSWYLMAHRLEPLPTGRGWRKEARGMRSGLKLARFSDLKEDPAIPFPAGLPKARQWLGTGDWLFRGDACENQIAVVALGGRLLHYFRERLESGLDDDMKLWSFDSPFPDWLRRHLPPSLCARLAADPVKTLGAYREAGNPEDDAQTEHFLRDDTPAAIVAFPYPYGAMGPNERRVGEFEAARRILSWGGEAVALAPTSLSVRVHELARIASDRQRRFLGG